MSILRNTTNRENFLIVSKIFLQDTTLSINERGLLASMHSLPDNWEFSIAGMMKILPDGKTKLKTALDGLIEKGYITIKQTKNSSGCFGGNILEINERPKPLKPLTENPPMENPPTVNPPAENQKQYNNNQYNTKKYNNNQSINPSEDEIDEIREEVKDQLDYDYACKQFGKDRIDGIVDIMVEVLLSVGTVNIGRNQIPAEQVKNIFRKIDMNHLGYIFDCIEETSREKKIRNMKSYLLTALYNAPMTMDVYYDSDYNYDSHNGGEE